MRGTDQHRGRTSGLRVNGNQLAGRDAVVGRIRAGLGIRQTILGNRLAVDHDVVAHALIRRNIHGASIIIELRPLRRNHRWELMGQVQPADLYIRGFLHRGFAGNRHCSAAGGLERVPIYRIAVHKEFDAIQLRESDSRLFLVISNLISHLSIQVRPSRRAV